MVTFTTKVVGGLHGKGQIQDMALATSIGKIVIVTIEDPDERPKTIHPDFKIV